MTRCFIKSKNAGGNIFSNLYMVTTMFCSNCCMSSTQIVLVHNVLKREQIRNHFPYRTWHEPMECNGKQPLHKNATIIALEVIKYTITQVNCTTQVLGITIGHHDCFQPQGNLSSMFPAQGIRCFWFYSGLPDISQV